ncbi:MAG: S8 family serine peptidase [Algoriphagus sp.]|uniref:S8 family serine peptidase n=1 Tax=Algoriphagus sp. TaxID=1872435 RepID=UPI002617C3ED|nr:S8 family serine peptidase [Algoriphagus sp.]MDG1277420.1 S8 family serine peptidase [Algoriphagus sp.]
MNKEAIKQKASQMGIPYLLELENGEIAELNFFDESNAPVYYTIFNTRAAITTSTNALQQGGSLGLNLTGKGMTVGIYDQTRPKPDHIEFQGRLTQVDGSTETISNHATHVSGTIMAGGVNANAKGMASEATGWAFNWESDLSKMNVNAYDPITKTNGHLVSNHSYGIVLGWYRNSSNAWVWAGNASVDPNEEYRFGFYSSKSKGLDDLIFAKPYYTVVWAAGNDRDDSGDGSRNPDGPDDTIGPEGVAKNVITVGAINNINEYTGPQDVAISSFSSVGPVDDGRIKPDVVGMGVNVFSSAIADGGATDSYASLSGTSMASPNVTGSLLLLQQLYAERNSGRYMWASTVKALMINTTKEAGNNPGPDYVYGWGLLSTKGAAEIILNENGSSDVIREEKLEQGAVFENEFISDGVTPIRISIAWTDPSGNPASPSVNPQNLMLVNDLDLRIVDEQGNTFFPYSLDPALRLSAKAETDKDNFRDNVEQIYIPNPKPQRYKVRVTHKGELKNGVQDFSFVMKAGTADGADETLYWIGASGGDWNNPSNWSTSSNGSAANKIPSAGSRVVFEGANAGSILVNFPTDANAFSVNLFGNQLVTFDLKGNEILVSNGFRVSNQITDIKNGKIVFTNSTINDQLVELGKAIFDDVELEFSSGTWQLLEAEKLDQVSVSNANLKIGFPQLNLNSLSLSSSSSLSGALEEIEIVSSVTISSNSTLKEGVDLVFSGQTGQFENNSTTDFSNLKIESGELNVLSGGFRNLEILSGKMIQTATSIEVEDLFLGAGSELNLDQSGSIAILNSISVQATSASKAILSASGKGKLIHELYKRYCFENLNVSNVDHEGASIVNLSTNASISNSTGWLAQNCEDVLFANFNSRFSCVGAASEFENLSEGAISTYLWDFGGKGTSTDQNPIFVFDQPGEYIVKLTISNSLGLTEFDQKITVVENDLQKPNIVANGNVLTSQQPGSSYQWYLNGAKIQGATNRSFEATGDGLYQVAIFDESCNRISEPTVISAIPDQEAELSRFGIFVGPIPTVDKLNITISNSYRGEIQLQLIDLAGRVYLAQEANKSEEELNMEMTMTGPAGMYILKINTNNLTLHKKVIKY